MFNFCVLQRFICSVMCCSCHCCCLSCWCLFLFSHPQFTAVCNFIFCLHPVNAMREPPGKQLLVMAAYEEKSHPFYNFISTTSLKFSFSLWNSETIPAVEKRWKLPVEIMPRNCIHSVPKTCAWLKSNKALHWATPGKHTLHMSKEYFV